MDMVWLLLRILARANVLSNSYFCTKSVSSLMRCQKTFLMRNTKLYFISIYKDIWCTHVICGDSVLYHLPLSQTWQTCFTFTYYSILGAFWSSYKTSQLSSFTTWKNLNIYFCITAIINRGTLVNVKKALKSIDFRFLSADIT